MTERVKEEIGREELGEQATPMRTSPSAYTGVSPQHCFSAEFPIRRLMFKYQKDLIRQMENNIVLWMCPRQGQYIRKFCILNIKVYIKCFKYTVLMRYCNATINKISEVTTKTGLPLLHVDH